MPALSAEQTLGRSPKVVWPALTVAGVGGACLGLGTLLDSARLRALGAGALGATVVSSVVGYVAPPGAVVAPDFDVVDTHEH